MRLSPYPLAVLLALSTITGLVGLMLLNGAWTLPFYILAMMPILLAALGLLAVGRGKGNRSPD